MDWFYVLTYDAVCLVCRSWCKGGEERTRSDFVECLRYEKKSDTMARHGEKRRRKKDVRRSAADDERNGKTVDVRRNADRAGEVLVAPNENGNIVGSSGSVLKRGCEGVRGDISGENE